MNDNNLEKEESLEERFREGVKTLLTTYDIRRMDGTTYGVSEEFEEDFKRILLSETARAREEGNREGYDEGVQNYMKHNKEMMELEYNKGRNQERSRLIAQVEGLDRTAHTCRFNDAPQTCDCYYQACDDIIRILNGKK
jgi:hypothetical protein